MTSAKLLDNTSLTPSHLIKSACTKPVSGHVFVWGVSAYFYDYSVGVGKCSDGVAFSVGVGKCSDGVAFSVGVGKCSDGVAFSVGVGKSSDGVAFSVFHFIS